MNITFGSCVIGVILQLSMKTQHNRDIQDRLCLLYLA